MYAIIHFTQQGGTDMVVPVMNEESGVRLFESLGEADNYANELEPNDEYRVISVEPVHE